MKVVFIKAKLISKKYGVFATTLCECCQNEVEFCLAETTKERAEKLVAGWNNH